MTKANLIVGTTNNYAPIQMSTHKAATSLIKEGKVTRRLAQHGRDGIPRLRSMLWLRHPFPARADAAGDHHPQFNGEMVDLIKQFVD